MSGIFSRAKVMLPKKGTDMSKWSVVACDQYTSEPKYWNDVADFVGDEPSMLNLILPEVYLESDDAERRIEKICASMNDYMEKGVLQEHAPSYIFVERTQADGAVRRGIIGKIDLEHYDYSKGSSSAVRATEGTILERIPPRMRVRENAPLESPHIMILIDDAERKIIEPLSDEVSSFEKAYDFRLMQDSGSIKGYFVSDEASLRIDSALAELGDIDNFNAKYGVNEKNPLIYAMGDGNHSLATAKACWEKLKSEGADVNTHPARYALAELVNLHDEALVFEPIHRVIFDADADKFIEFLAENGVKKGNGAQTFRLVVNGEETAMHIENPTANIAVGSVQNLIDRYLSENDGTVDYIHGNDVVMCFAEKSGNIGLLFDVMDKSELFKTVILDGALPRKTFSMGHAHDKRFYTECRKIK